MIYGFAAIAALILLIACFNFMNLATARAIVRSREISLRKVMGARRGQLIAQFLGESVITALVGLVVALALVETLLPGYDSFLNRPINFNVLIDWPLTLSVVVIAIAAGLLGGIYPALVLSAFSVPPEPWGPVPRASVVPASCAPALLCCSSQFRSGLASPPSLYLRSFAIPSR